LIQLAEKSESY